MQCWLGPFRLVLLFLLLLHLLGLLLCLLPLHLHMPQRRLPLRVVFTLLSHLLCLHIRRRRLPLPIAFRLPSLLLLFLALLLPL